MTETELLASWIRTKNSEVFAGVFPSWEVLKKNCRTLASVKRALHICNSNEVFTVSDRKTTRESPRRNFRSTIPDEFPVQILINPTRRFF